MNYHVLVLHAVILLSVNPSFAQTTADVDPVVISFGDQELTRRQFDLEFEATMVLNAVKTGTPVKNQDQIYTMQRRFLKQRARELVYLDEAEKRGIYLSDKALAPLLDGFMQELGFSEYSDKNAQRLGFFSPDELKRYVRERALIRKLVNDINDSLKAGDNKSALSSRLDSLYNESGVRLYPEYLIRPLN